jgi:hypothetical protein
MNKDMNEEFDFKKVGKRMPYSVPDGFFDQLENRVMSEIQQETKPKKGRIVKMTFGALTAAAAAVALFFVVHKSLPENVTTDESFSLVELAYNDLSSEDQEYLLQVYEEDLFINEENNNEEE